MVDLVEWLTACLDEDERIARAATQGKWVWSREFVTPPGYHHRTVGPLEPGDAAYIVAHDPARVLREIDAKREALDHYAKLQRLAKGGVAIYRAAAGAVGVQIQIMALAYADRPGYQEAWRPEHLD